MEGSVLVYDFWTPPHPPPINFVHDHLFLSINLLLFIFLLFRVRLQVKIFSGPSAAARLGQGAERCGHGLGQLRHFLGRALRLGWARGPSAAATGQVKLRHFLSDPCTKLTGGGGEGVQKSYTRKLPDEAIFWSKKRSLA